MSDNLDALANWLQPLVVALEPAARHALAAQIARDLRTHTQATMRAQTAPDGAAWEARRQAITTAYSVRGSAAQAKKRRGPMMAKLAQAKYLKPTATANAAGLSFAQRVQRVASIHHHGLPDAVATGGPTYHYPERPLLGISDDITARVKDLVLAHLQGQ